jgi:geranylgeranyl pyrophosphate synthase
MSQMSVSIEDLLVPSQLLLRERLQKLLAALDQRLRADVVRSLEEPGKLLWRSNDATGRPAGVWGLLTLLVAEYLSPEVNPAYASTVAVGVECYICALDLIDDVEDADQTPILEDLGVARGLSVATTLLFLAQEALLSASAYVPPAQVLLLLEALSECSLKAAQGQHLDILSAQQPALRMTAQTCLGILAAKSGALMSLACRLGALCAGVSEPTCSEWASLGELLGLSHQLDNDAHDFRAGLATDILVLLGKDAQGSAGRRAKTLPLVLAAHIYSEQRSHVFPASTIERGDPAVWQLALQEAFVSTSCQAVLYRERARTHIEQLHAQRPLQPALRFLLVG